MTDKLSFSPRSPVRDYTENVNIIEQGVLSDEVQERIRKAERGELKAKLADILDRGILNDRLTVELPDDLHGEWCKNDPLEIRRLEALGFKVDTEYASKRAIHSDGSDSAIVGDVIFMTCQREIKDAIDEIRREAIIKQHEKKKIKGKELNREEIELYNNVFNQDSKNITAFSESKEKKITPEDISSILEDLKKQEKEK